MKGNESGSYEKSRSIVLVISLAVIVVGLSGVLAFRWQSARSAAQQSARSGTALNLGITYLAITPTVAAYYGLGLDHGALVTAVFPGSPAALAGIKVGDVIESFNGVEIKDGGTLLGLILSCPSDNQVTVEVWRGNGSSLVQFCAGQQ